MSIEKLVRDHAHWADRARELKELGSKAADICARRQPKPGMSDEERWRALNSENCIAATYNDWDKNSDPREYGGREQSFEEWWHEARASGDACDACQRVRDLRAERMLARRRLGAVRAAITRVGRALQEVEPQS